MSTLENAQESWSLSETRSLIEARQFLPEKRAEALLVVDALDKYVQIFRYHLALIQKIEEAHFPEKAPDIEAFKKVLGLDAVFRRDWLAYQANFIAAVHTVRNLYDVFSQLVNLIADTGLSKKSCSLYSVRNALTTSELKDELDSVCENEDFKYVSAFSNTIKHRDLIPFTPTVAFGPDAFVLRISAFEYDNRLYDSFKTKDMLKKIVLVQNQLLDCGKSLNLFLRESA